MGLMSWEYMIEEIKAVKEIAQANAKAVYEDAAQPSIRVVGKSLAQCVSLFVTPVGRMSEIFERNIHRYIDKLEGLEEEDLIAPDTRILVPILEKMRFTDEEKVADYYAEILATASKKEHAKKVLVTFIEILNRLTADEIKILEYINSPLNQIKVPELTEEEAKNYGISKNIQTLDISGSLPVIDIHQKTKEQTGYRVLKKNFNCLREYIELSSPENIDSYIDNMISLGLLEKRHMFRFAIDKIYYHLENHPIVLAIKKKIESNPKLIIEFEDGRIDITDLGRKLLALCSRQEV